MLTEFQAGLMGFGVRAGINKPKTPLKHILAEFLNSYIKKNYKLSDIKTMLCTKEMANRNWTDALDRRKCSRGRCDKFLKPVTPVHGINQMGRLLSIITHV